MTLPFAIDRPVAQTATASFPLMALQRWLVTIPLDQRAIAFAAYEVRRK